MLTDWLTAPRKDKAAPLSADEFARLLEAVMRAGAPHFNGDRGCAMPRGGYPCDQCIGVELAEMLGERYPTERPRYIGAFRAWKRRNGDNRKAAPERRYAKSEKSGKLSIAFFDAIE